MRVLLVVPPERTDFYDYLAKAGDFEFLLLWHEKRSQLAVDPARLPLDFAEIHYWQDHATPAALLEAVRPDKIVFFEIIDLRQIALIVAARAAGITTFYLEHGAAGDRATAIARWTETRFFRDKLPYLVKRALRALPDAISSKRFYYAQRRGFESRRSYLSYLLLPFRMARAGPNQVLAANLFRERVPDWSILFNEVNFDHCQVYIGIDRSEALLPGLPFYDNFYQARTVERDHVVFIDHPYLEEGLLGWTADHHARVADALAGFAAASGRKVFVKLHPRSDPACWSGYGFDPARVEVVQHGDFTRLYLEAALILGFSSSLLIGFLCARKNVVLLGWHPEPQIFGADFARTGLCHKSMEPDELGTLHGEWLAHNKALDEPAYLRFLKAYNWPFDGRAGERVIDAIRSL